MKQQLGIKKLRPGFSGNESAPNHANYDEALANPCPQLPDLLTTKDGKKVTTGDLWWKQRRPELIEDFEREVYGRVPNNTPKVTWTVKITDREFVGRIPVIAKMLVGHVDNSAAPADRAQAASRVSLIGKQTFKVFASPGLNLRQFHSQFLVVQVIRSPPLHH